MVAIIVEHLHKQFTLHHNNPHSLKVMLTKFTRPKKEVHHVLKDVSFTVKSGETLAIIGKNGSGKSTMLGVLVGIYRTDGGSVKTFGKIAPLLELGAGFHPDLSGVENIFLNGSILGLSRKQIRERFDSIVEFADLAKFIDSPIRTYSSGMTARLGFSVAIHTDPDILIVDEVLGVGDAAFQAKCTAKIREFQAEGKTIIFVSHTNQAIRDVATRAIWLENGYVRADGNVDEVLDEYLQTQNV